MIEIRGLRYAYPAQAPSLDGVDLAVSTGELVLLAGPSGSGKSTLLRCLNGLVPHFHGGQVSGEVRVAGRDVLRQPPAAMMEAVGLVPQNPAGALFNSSVAREIAFGLESLGVPPAEIGPRVHGAAAQVGLGEALDRVPHTLSGGEQQRLLIAAVVAARPAVLALDEPFAHLDPEMGEVLVDVLTRLAASGITVVVAEHRLGQLLPHADRLVVLQAGRVVHDDAPAAVMTSDVRRFGLNVPLAVRVARAIGLRPVPLSLDGLVSRLTPAALADLDIPVADAFLPPPASARSPDPAGPPALAFEGATLAGPSGPLLHGLDLAVGAGEVVAILGRNGVGKTTLLKHCNGLVRPAKGVVRVAGVPTTARPVSAWAQAVGFVFQNPNDQIFRPTVRDELVVAPHAVGRHDAPWLAGLVERLDLGPLLDRSPFRLSEGQKKRVTFAAALAVRPRIAVLDEPTTGQDEPFREALVALLSDLAHTGSAVLMATHDVELADAAASRWAVLADGRLDAVGPPSAVMADVETFRAAGLRPGGWTWLRQVLSVAGRLG